MGRPRGKPFAALGRGPPVPSAALRPAPGPPLSSFVALGEISAQDSRGGTARQDLGRLQACPPDLARGGGWGGSAALKTSRKATPDPQTPPQGFCLLLVLEAWAPWSTVHGRAEEGRNQHPRITKFSPTPSRPGWRGSPKSRRAWTASARVGVAGGGEGWVGGEVRKVG